MDAPLRTGLQLTCLIVPLAVFASASGLLWPGLYRDNDWVVPQNRGQDLVTLLLAAPLLAGSGLRAARGSRRASIAWLGLLGYFLYTYTGAVFAFAFNPLFLAYVALFSLSTFALVAVACGIDAQDIAQGFETGAPRRTVVAFLIALALLLTSLWLRDILPALAAGSVPQSVRLAGGPTFFVYALDLGLVVPLSVLAALWLHQRRPWGYILAGGLLAKASAMGLALLSMTWFTWRAQQPVDPGLTAAYVAIATAGLGLSVWWLRPCRG